MKWLYERLYRKDKGFTLIELLIVIIILAVLAGIAIPSYLSITKRAKESATEAEIASIAVAIEMYNADNGEYPSAATTAILGDYMAKVPVNDKWETPYVYNLTDGVYTLTSYGIDTETGGSDDIIFTDGQQTGMGAY